MPDRAQSARLCARSDLARHLSLDERIGDDGPTTRGDRIASDAFHF